MAKIKPLRARIHPYLSSELVRRLDEYVAARGMTESAVVAEALHRHLGGMGDRDILYKRLDHMSRTIDGVGKEVADLRGDICELRQHVLAQGQLLQLLVPTFLSLLQLVPPDKRPGKAPWLQSAVRDLYGALGQRIAKDHTLLSDLPAEVREALQHKVTEKRWSLEPDQGDEEPRAGSVGAQPDTGDDAPDDIWFDTEPDDRHG